MLPAFPISHIFGLEDESKNTYGSLSAMILALMFWRDYFRPFVGRNRRQKSFDRYWFIDIAGSVIALSASSIEVFLQSRVIQVVVCPGQNRCGVGSIIL